MARHGVRHLRGSDQTERIFIVVTVLMASGWSENEACLFVADHANVRLGQSRRGRPAKRTHSRDLSSKVQTVRAIVNRFKRADPMNLVRFTVDTFRWQRENRILEGSKYPEDSGLRLQEAYRRRVASLGLDPDRIGHV